MGAPDSKKCPKGKQIAKHKFQNVLIAPSWGPEGLIESGLVNRLIEDLLKFEAK